MILPCNYLNDATEGAAMTTFNAHIEEIKAELISVHS